MSTQKYKPKNKLEEAEKQIIIDALVLAKGNQIKAAKALVLNRNTVRQKILKYGISIKKLKKLPLKPELTPLDAVLDYIFDSERRDFEENPSNNHVYFKAMVCKFGKDAAQMNLERVYLDGYL